MENSHALPQSQSGEALWGQTRSRGNQQENLRRMGALDAQHLQAPRTPAQTQGPLDSCMRAALVVGLAGVCGHMLGHQIDQEDAGANILHSYIHDFGNGGVSGVIVLEESHISIHTWPEKAFAAIDVYLCGDCTPIIAIEYLIQAFHPEKYEYVDIKRGITSQK